jgi:phosphinothricin acetyltransferase
MGWGALSPFHKRAAFRFTAENSVYVGPAFQRRGVGRALLGELLKRAAAGGLRAVVAVISSDQAPSVALHRSLGFVECGILRKVGFKFGRWLDVTYMEWLNADFRE